MKLLQGKPKDPSILERELELMKEDKTARKYNLGVELYDNRVGLSIKGTLNYFNNCVHHTTGYDSRGLVYICVIPLVIFGASFMPHNKDSVTGKYILRTHD